MTARKSSDEERRISPVIVLSAEEAEELNSAVYRLRTNYSRLFTDLARRWLAERRQEKPPSAGEDG